MRALTQTLVLVASGLLAPGLHAQADSNPEASAACEAIMCFSSGKNTAECQGPKNRYFSINGSKPADTSALRLNFLKKCTGPEQVIDAQSLVSIIANGAGRCDAGALNSELKSTHRDQDDKEYTVINNQIPANCTAFFNRPYREEGSTERAPTYIGTPGNGGYWSN